MSTLSVVIPTYNRCKTLQKALSAYLEQTALQAIAEILVVDDGSTDSTQAVVAALARESTIPIRCIGQENKGPAAARNAGISEASSELILFTDDDIIPGPTLVAEHLEWHKKFPELSTAVLGYVTWAPEIKPTPFMNWYASDGPLFAFAHIEGRTELDYIYFYTCNLSLKTEFLRRNGTFDEDFKVAAYEDIELGYRLDKAGMRLLYNAKALAYHQQYFSFDDACRRHEKAAAAAEVFGRKKAGMYFHSCQQTVRPSAGRQRLKRQLALALSPLKTFMDWKVPLPRSLYRMMYRVYR
jgi:glycosyltransferase involved in cell wall biosynthesis